MMDRGVSSFRPIVKNTAASFCPTARIHSTFGDPRDMTAMILFVICTSNRTCCICIELCICVICIYKCRESGENGNMLLITNECIFTRFLDIEHAMPRMMKC